MKKTTKKITFSLWLISLTMLVVIGATWAYFGDAESSALNELNTGTLEIAINDQNPWTENFSFTNLQPGDSQTITLNIKNEGTYPLKIWQLIDNVASIENGVNEPEQTWYDQYNGGQEKNDLESVFSYELYINNQLALERETGITLGQIKDSYLNLVKIDTGAKPPTYGLLNPGESIEVKETFVFQSATANWAQSDQLAFDLTILAQQTETAEPLHQLSFINNKNQSTWIVTADAKGGLLKFDNAGENFDFSFFGTGLNANTNYSLIYYADPWPGNGLTHVTGNLIATGAANSQGQVNLSGSVNLNTDLPNSDDKNYPHGAKIWLVPSSGYNTTAHSIIGWDGANYLFENWPGFINYRQGPKPAEPTGDRESDEAQTVVVSLDELGGDVDNQYGYNHNYQQSQVIFNYLTPQSQRLNGQITASGLKPFTTYQVKFEGRPTCQYGPSGNDQANENIGYLGRWTCVSANCASQSASARNRTDVQYEANKLLPDTDPNKECLVGYLVWDYFTADSTGSAAKNIISANSYHVLWSNGGLCNTAVNNYLEYLDPAHPTVLFSAVDKVGGQLERGTCNGLILDTGNYDLTMVLTEESFHQGNWASVLKKNINFTIE